jgi:hypothetical protein
MGVRIPRILPGMLFSLPTSYSFPLPPCWPSYVENFPSFILFSERRNSKRMANSSTFNLFQPTLPNIGLAVLCFAILGYVLYRRALPKPLAGIPYNKHAAQRILGDFPDVAKWHAKTGGEIWTWVRLLSA